MATKKSKVVVKDNGWDELKMVLRRLGHHEVVVGIPGPVDVKTPNKAGLGAIHEFGTLDGHIKHRSFLRSTFDKNERKYARLMVKGLKKQISQRRRDIASLLVLGETVRADVIKRIESKDIRQELAASTLAAKAPRDKALIAFTGSLVGSITSKVRRAK